MSKSGRVVVALMIGFAVFAAMTWFDNSLLVDARRQASADFDASIFGILWSLGAIAVAASALAIGGLAWWSQSWIVGVIFLVFGAVFALVPIIVLRQGSPAPGWLNDLFLGMGPMSAMIILGAAMVVSGVAAISRDVQVGRQAALAPVSRGRSGRPR